MHCFRTIPRLLRRQALFAAFTVTLAVLLPLSQAAAATSVLSLTPNWTTTGGATNNFFGYSVANAGDVNNDGYDDVVVGAYGTANGTVYLYLGSPSGLAATPATTLTGASSGDRFGYSVAGAGDVNKDGRDDVIVGAPGTGNDVGAAYLFVGAATGLNSTALWTVSSASNNSFFGSSVASAGDVNKDTNPDVIIGAYGNGSSGRAYVYHGTGTTLSTSAAWNVAGPALGEDFGFSVAGAGDVNGDTYSDVIVGAPSNDSSGTDRGRVYIYLGGATGLSTTAATNRTGEANSNFFGYSVAGAGNVNGDAYGDVIIGAYGNGTSNTGKAYVYAGNSNSTNPIGATAAWTAVGETTSNFFGYSVRGGGDVNKDSYADVIVGAYGNSSSIGKAYVYLGSSTGLATSAAWSATGVTGSQFGKSVSGAGDVNGDTYADVVVGAPAYTTNTGRAYAYYTDYTAPTVTITAQPANPTNSTSASFSFSATDNTGGSGVASYACQLDSGGYSACTSPKSYSGLTAGTHTFYVTATDNAGNTSTAQSYTWTIDTTGPTVTVNQAAGQADPTNSLPIVFTAVFNEAVSGFTNADVTLAGTANVGSATVSVTGGPSSYTISVSGVTGNGTVIASIGANKATDAAGNNNAASTSTDNSVTYYSDSTAPVVTITGKPADPTKLTSATFSFSATDTGGTGVASYACKLDGGSYSPCTSGVNYSALGEGNHTFSVTATDVAGNTSAAQSYTWLIDLTAPVVSIDSQPGSLSNSSSVSFSFSATDNTGGSGVVSYACKLDGGAYSACTSPQSYTSLSDGSHTFSVTATDNAGNTSTAQTYTWTIDATAPSLTVNQASGQADPTASLPIVFTAVFNEAVTGFTDADVTLAGTADLSAATVSVTGGPSSYTISIGGVSGNGTVIATVAANVATDSAGNGNAASTSTDNSVTYYSDSAAPVVSIDSGPAQFSSSTSPSFGFSATDTGGSGVASYACGLDGGAAAACTSPHAVGPLSDGSHTFSVTATDHAGNTSAAETYTWVVDTVAPVVSIDSKPGSLSNSSSAGFSFSATDTSGSGVLSYTCTVDSVSATCTSPLTLSSLADGSHSFSVTATDKAGNVASAQSYAWVVDTTAPVVTIDSKPSDPSNNSSPTFAFSATDAGSGVASYTCTVDGGTPTACTSPHAVGPLSEASHTFSVTATDAAGNTSAAASYTWVVDTTAPVVTIDSKPGNPSNNSSPTFAFSATDVGGSGVASYMCTVDGGAPTACTSSLTLNSLTDGNHSFSVTATDNAGNMSSAAVYAWAIDTAVPVVSISAGPANPSNSTSASFTFAATDVGSGIAAYTCALDGNAPVACTSPYSYTGLSEGSHSFSVTATDLAGNTSAAASQAWVVDVTAPVVSISSGPANPTNNTGASISFAATDVGGSGVTSYACSLDGGAAVACTSPATYSALAEGGHTFSVTATDAAGNTSIAATHAWAVDTTAPVASIDSKPSNPTNSTDASFGFSATDAGSGVASYTCSLDSSTPTACTSPQNYNGLAQGNHTFSVIATDHAGNTSSPAIYTWTINTTAPSLSIDSKPGNPSNSNTAGFSFSATDAGGAPITSFTCQLDGGAAAACASPVSYPGLADGTHTFSVTATDSASNSSSSSYTWAVDTAAPATPTVSGPHNPSNSAGATLTFAATDAGGSGVASYTCKLDSGAAAACTSPASYTGLTEGEHTFSVIATDNAGNSSGAASFTWVVDTTAPVVSIDSKPGSPSNSSSAGFGFSATDVGGSGVASYHCSLDGVTAACTSPLTLSSLADGSHLFSVTATDAAGNISAAANHTWVVDTTAPAVSISSGPANPTNSTAASISFAATDANGTGVASYTCKLDGGAAAPCTSPASYSGLSAGNHVFSVTATDTAGNTSAAATHSWTIDTTAPSLTVNQASGQADPTASLPIVFTAVFNEAVTGFTSADVTLAGTANVGGATVSVTGGPSSYTISVGGVSGNGTVIATVAASVATDGAGNGNAASTSTDNSVTYFADTTAPVASISSGPGSLTNSSSASFSFSATDAGGSGVASYTCKLDGGAPAPCTSPASYSGLAAGNHAFTVTATDGAGNNSAPVSYTWTIDTTGPTVTVNQAAGQADPTNSLPIVFTAVFNEAVSGFTNADVTLAGTASLGSATVSVTGGPSSYTISVSGVTGNGTVIASIGANKATDAAGNNNAASTSTDNSVTFNSSTTGPVAPTVSGPDGFSNSNSPTFTFSSSGAASYACSLDGAAPASCSSPVTLGALPDGVHTFTVTARDASGNPSTPTVHTWTVDTTPPVASAAAAPQPNAAGWNNTDVTVTFSATDSGSGVAGCTVPVVLSSEGVHTAIAGVCTDKAGNSSAPASVASVKIDKTAPTDVSGAPVSGPTGAGGWYLEPITVQFTGSDALSGIASCTSVTYAGPSSPAATVAGTCTDNAGNTSAPVNSEPFAYSTAASELYLPLLSR